MIRIIDRMAASETTSRYELSMRLGAAGTHAAYYASSCDTAACISCAACGTGKTTKSVCRAIRSPSCRCMCGACQETGGISMELNSATRRAT